MSCEGTCTEDGSCVGAVVRVSVFKEFVLEAMVFDYCEAAAIRDRYNGFTVEVLA